MELVEVEGDEELVLSRDRTDSYIGYSSEDRFFY